MEKIDMVCRAGACIELLDVVIWFGRSDSPKTTTYCAIEMNVHVHVGETVLYLMPYDLHSDLHVTNVRYNFDKFRP